MPQRSKNDSSTATASSLSRLASSTPKVGLMVGMGALVMYGLTRRTKSGLALASVGSVIAFKAAQSTLHPSEYTARTNFLINCKPEEAYTLWRSFDNLPRFMSHLKSVKVLDGKRSEWVAIGPGDVEVRWAAEITEDEPDRKIAWKSLPGSDIRNSGSVRFETGPVGRGTMVTAEVSYDSPEGALGRGLIAMFGKHPDFVVREDVRRFKALVEARETPTTEGQTHGPRGASGRLREFLFRETSNHPEPQAGQASRRSA